MVKKTIEAWTFRQVSVIKNLCYADEYLCDPEQRERCEELKICECGPLLTVATRQGRFRQCRKGTLTLNFPD